MFQMETASDGVAPRFGFFRLPADFRASQFEKERSRAGS